MISTQIHKAIPNFDEIIQTTDPDFAQTRLKSESVLRLSRLAVVSESIFVGKLGEISQIRLKKVKENLANWIRNKTKPIANNGFGWTPAKTDVEISRLESLLTVLPDSQAIYREWRKARFRQFVSRQTSPRCPNRRRNECSPNHQIAHF